MTDEPWVSRYENEQLYKKAIMPVMLTVIAFFTYFVYLMESSSLAPSSSMSDFMLKWALPFVCSFWFVITLSIETLYYLKVKKPVGFHLKRFGAKMMLGLTELSLLCAVMALVGTDPIRELGWSWRELSIVVFGISFVPFVAILYVFRRAFGKHLDAP